MGGAARPGRAGRRGHRKLSAPRAAGGPPCHPVWLARLWMAGPLAVVVTGSVVGAMATPGAAIVLPWRLMVGVMVMTMMA